MAGKTKWDREREEWIAAVRDLCDTIGAWCEGRHWFVHEEAKTITEEHLGTYTVPALLIQGIGGRIQVDPVAREVLRCDGRVDLIPYPTVNGMMLLRFGNEWRLTTDSGIRWPRPWSEETFFSLSKELISVA